MPNPCLQVENFTHKTTPKRGPKHKHQNKSMKQSVQIRLDKTQAQTYVKTKDIIVKNVSFVFVRLA